MCTIIVVHNISNDYYIRKWDYIKEALLMYILLHNYTNNTHIKWQRTRDEKSSIKNNI